MEKSEKEDVLDGGDEGDRSASSSDESCHSYPRSLDSDDEGHRLNESPRRIAIEKMLKDRGRVELMSLDELEKAIACTEAEISKEKFVRVVRFFSLRPWNGNQNGKSHEASYDMGNEADDEESDCPSSPSSVVDTNQSKRKRNVISCTA